MQAQPDISFNYIGVHWPDVSLYFQAKCGSDLRLDITKDNFDLTENGIPIPEFSLSCPDPNTHCCVSAALVMDRSSRMGLGNPTALQNEKDYAKAFVSAFDGKCDEATLISFSNQVTVDAYMTNVQAVLNQKIDALQAFGSNAAWDACIVGLNELENRGTQQCRALLLFTDGKDNSSQHTVSDVIAAALQKKIRIFTIGVGTGINETDLQKIATETGGRYYMTPSVSQMPQIYQEISTIILHDFYECEIAYKSLCADGKKRDVVLTLKNLSGCTGSVTKTKSYNAPFDSTSLQKVKIKLSNSEVIWGEDTHIDLILSDSLNNIFSASTFDVMYDNTCCTFLDISSNGFLLDGIPITHQVIPGGVRVTITKEALVNGPGVLASMRFKVGKPLQPTSCPLTLTNWIFTSANFACVTPTIQNGNINIKFNLTLLSPNGGEEWCTGTVQKIEWLAQGPKQFELELSTDGGLTFNQSITNGFSGTSCHWLVPINQPVSRKNVFRIKELGTNVMDTNDSVFSISTIPQIINHPFDTLVCEGQNASFISSASGNPTPNVQWELSTDAGTSWIDVVGETRDTLVLQNISYGQNNFLYRTRFTNACTQVYTQYATLRVNTIPIIITHPNDVVACPGKQAVFTSSSNAVPSASIQWQRSIDSGKSWINIAGETRDSLIITNAQQAFDGNKYRALFSNVCQSLIASNAALLFVRNNPVIDQQPRDTIVCTGSTVQYITSAIGTSAQNIQWEVSQDAGSTWVNLFGENSDTLILKNVFRTQNGYKYRALLTNNCGTIASNTASLTVHPQTPTILVQPKDSDICEGDSALFEINSANTIKYQWRKNGIVLPAETLSTYKIQKITTFDQGRFDVIAYNVCGQLISDAATLTVETAPQILQHPIAQSVKENDSVLFSINASGKNITYQWLKDGVPIQGATSSSFTILLANKSDEGNYSVEIHGVCGGPIFSQSARLNVTLTSISETTSIPAVPVLYQNNPNPFSTTTTIKFSIPVGTFNKTSLHIYDFLGREVKTLINGAIEPGNHEVMFDAKSLSNGIYFYRLEGDRFAQTKMMTVMK